MRISLVYKKSAGDGVRPDHLEKQLARAGHHVVHVLESEPDPQRATRDGVDLVVVAGGDGTVARAALRLAGQPWPMAILPMGTANNIAKSLGQVGPLPALIAGFAAGRPLTLDLGRACGTWGERRFVEAVGGGWIAAGITAMEEHPLANEGDVDKSLARALRTYQDVLRSLRPRPMELRLDGERRDGEFLLVEVLNFRYIGANVLLSPGADPSDGWFDVVTAGEQHRPQLEAYVRSRIEGTPGELQLPCRRARRVEVHGHEDLHIDDAVRPGVTSTTATIEPGAVRMLIAP